jgi:hypothetical protein
MQETTERLKRAQQEHLLVGADTLGAQALTRFLNQINSLPLEELADMLAQTSSQKSRDLSVLTPPNVIRYDTASAVDFRTAGEEMIRRGQVAAFTVAGSPAVPRGR